MCLYNRPGLLGHLWDFQLQANLIRQNFTWAEQPDCCKSMAGVGTEQPVNKPGLVFNPVLHSALTDLVPFPRVEAENWDWCFQRGLSVI